MFRPAYRERSEADCAYQGTKVAKEWECDCKEGTEGAKYKANSQLLATIVAKSVTFEARKDIVYQRELSLYVHLPQRLRIDNNENMYENNKSNRNEPL